MSNQVPEKRYAKEPSMLDACIPVISLVALLATAVIYFGNDSSYGPNQIGLLVAMGIAIVIGLKNGHQWREIEKAIVNGISLSLGAVLILLAVGSLIGTWLLSGTVPTMIYYGLQILSPSWFYAAACIICGIVALSIGSSWTTAATIGVALIGIAQGLSLDPAITAGAVISGAYFGDKISPLSETTNLAPAVAGSELFAHIRYMFWTTIPSISTALVLFLFLGFNAEVTASSSTISDLSAQLAQQFNISLFNLIPLVVLLVFLVLAAQYESWSLPMAIILIVPMTLLSAMTGVIWDGGDNNIFTQIGLIVLVGLATKNAILIVEFAKEKEDQHKFFFWYKKENRKWIKDTLTKVGRNDLLKKLLPEDTSWKKNKAGKAKNTFDDTVEKFNPKSRNSRNRSKGGFKKKRR